MRIKLTASVLVLMVYVQFMAPFVIVPTAYTPRPPRNLEDYVYGHARDLKDVLKTIGDGVETYVKKVDGLVDDVDDAFKDLNKNFSSNVNDAYGDGGIKGTVKAGIVVVGYAVANAAVFMVGMLYIVGGAMVLLAGYVMAFFLEIGKWIVAACVLVVAWVGMLAKALWELTKKGAEELYDWADKKVFGTHRKLQLDDGRKLSKSNFDTTKYDISKMSQSLKTKILNGEDTKGEKIPDYLKSKDLKDAPPEIQNLARLYQNRERIQKWVDRIAKGLDLINQEAESLKEKSSWSKFTGVFSSESAKAPPPPMTKEELRHAYRKLYSDEYDDLIQQKKDLEEVPKLDEVKKDKNAQHYHENKIRRAGLKTRIGKVVNLIQTNVYNLKKYRNSYTYKKTIYPMEIERVIQDIGDPKKKDQQEANKKILDEILKRESAGTTPEQVNMNLTMEINEQYFRAGLLPVNIAMKFFSSYVRAAFICVMRLDIVGMNNYKKDKGLKGDDLKTHNEAVDKLNQTIQEVSSDVDFD